MTDTVREQVSLASRILASQGHDDLIWGHASVRDQRGCWIKSAEWGLGEVTPERVHLVDAAGSVVEGDGPRHSEYPIHTEVLAMRPDVGAVVHTHPPHAVALGATGQPLIPVSHAATMFVPPAVPRFTETADLVLTPELGRKVAEELGDASALLLANHGIVTVGPDLETATVRAVVLERACHQQLLTHAFGGWPRMSNAVEAEAKREHIYHESAVHAVWNHLVRQLG
ncbi:L-fuculose-phosphate aldolase [Pseudonocardia ammonioxydans]|uniref:L-fuculose-phosphate aldolase n=1 Tax=Pseudonocardia ammonioxydans TaxID=260086 RepID=A0A1I5HSE1_PSUAM|nr:class II aldolase/adducin family protein [Pseudonocardia ammonioxydans]SFO51212.1 L-fuculose-phosphate aldolase [Pseudonocardia ammonioxydans]